MSGKTAFYVSNVESWNALKERNEAVMEEPQHSDDQRVGDEPSGPNPYGDHPEWNVWLDGKIIGRDPSYTVRLSLLREHYTGYGGGGD